MLSWIKKITELDIHQIFLILFLTFYTGFIIISNFLIYIKSINKIYDKPIIEDSTGIKELIFKND